MSQTAKTYVCDFQPIDLEKELVVGGRLSEALDKLLENPRTINEEGFGPIKNTFLFNKVKVS